MFAVLEIERVGSFEEYHHVLWLQVGYEAGSGGARLAPACMNDLDNELVPVIHRAASNITQQPIILELVFHIMEQ